MAAPTRRAGITPVAGLSVTSGVDTAIGDMVIVATWERAGAGVPTHTLQANFVELFSQAHDDGSTDGRLSVAYKIATASGAQSYQAYTSSVGTETWSGGIVVQVDTFSATATNKGPTASAGVSQTNNAVPNPPSVTLGTSRDWLVIVFGGWHHSTSATITPTAPTNYTNLIEVAGSTTGDLGIANRSLTAPASEDPGTFGDNIAPNGTAAVTIGIGSIVVTTRTAAVDGVGGIATVATFFSVFEQSAAVGATAAVTVSGEVVPQFTTHERAAALDAQGSIASSGQFFSVFSGAVVVDTVGLIATVPQRELVRAVAVGASGSVAAIPQRELFRSSALDAAPTITVSSQRDLLRAGEIGATAFINASGQIVMPVERAVSLNADADISVSRQVEFNRAVDFDTLADITLSSTGRFRNRTALYSR